MLANTDAVEQSVWKAIPRALKELRRSKPERASGSTSPNDAPEDDMVLVRDTRVCRSQQPGKPTPPGNPQKHPDHDVPPPIEDPPEPVPTPWERDDPAPMNV